MGGLIELLSFSEHAFLGGGPGHLSHTCFWASVRERSSGRVAVLALQNCTISCAAHSPPSLKMRPVFAMFYRSGDRCTRSDPVSVQFG